MDILIEEK